MLFAFSTVGRGDSGTRGKSDNLFNRLSYFTDDVFFHSVFRSRSLIDQAIGKICLQRFGTCSLEIEEENLLISGPFFEMPNKK